MSKCGTLMLLLAMAALAAGCGTGADNTTTEADGGEDAAATTAQGAGNNTPKAGNASEGGDTSEGGDAAVESSSLSKPAYIKRASTICARAGQQILNGLATAQEGGATSQDEAARYEALNESVLIPPIESELNELRALGAPTGDEARIERILSAMQQGIEANQASPPTSLEDFGARFSRFDQLAEAYGLSECVFFE